MLLTLYFHCMHCRMARRKKRNIGRRYKNYEKKIQQLRKFPRGRPKKKPLHTRPTQVPPPPTIVSLSDINKNIQLPSLWSKSYTDTEYKVYKVEDVDGCLKVTRSILIKADCSWAVHVHGTNIANPTMLPILTGISSILTVEDAQCLLNKLDTAMVCPAHPDPTFIGCIESFKDKVFLTRSKDVLAELDTFAPVTLKGVTYSKTVRPKLCHMIVQSGRCSSCTQARQSILQRYNRWKTQQETTPTRHTASSSHTNLRYMASPLARQRLQNVQKELRAARNKLSRLESKISQQIGTSGVNVSSETHEDLKALAEELAAKVRDEHSETSFQRLFWEQQLRASQVKNHRQMRWHPTMIRWSLYLKSKSTTAYDALRKVIKLPSGRTLRDYTHLYDPKLGFQTEVDQQLYEDLKVDELAEWQKHIGLVFDEMKIKEGIVYDKHCCEILGFINLGGVTNQLLEFEKLCDGEDASYIPPVAKYICCFMIRGIFMNINFPYAQFATTSISSDELFPLIWEAIKRLEVMGLKVMFLTGDGASSNRKFFNMHQDKKGELTYKTPNIYSSDGRFIYFFVDTPHLLKTTRNCFSQSFSHGHKRALWVIYHYMHYYVSTTHTHMYTVCPAKKS